MLYTRVHQLWRVIQALSWAATASACWSFRTVVLQLTPNRCTTCCCWKTSRSELEILQTTILLQTTNLWNTKLFMVHPHCVALQIAAERLAGLNPRLYNFQVGNFEYTEEELHLGQLQGDCPNCCSHCIHCYSHNKAARVDCHKQQACICGPICGLHRRRAAPASAQERSLLSISPKKVSCRFVCWQDTGCPVKAPPCACM